MIVQSVHGMMANSECVPVSVFDFCSNLVYYDPYGPGALVFFLRGATWCTWRLRSEGSLEEG